MDNTFYNNYKTLKEKLDYNYKGYNLKNMIPGYLSFVFDGLTPSAKDVLKSFYNTSRSIDLRKATQSKSKNVITYLIGRTDYKNLANATQKYYPQSEVLNLSELPTVKFSFFSISYFWHFLLSTKIVLSRSVGGSIMTRLNLIAILLRILNQITMLERTKQSIVIDRYICFNSAYREESILTQYFNKRKIETVTLQHGIFCEYKLLVPFDYINFENMIASEVLCWGQATVDYFVTNGIDASRLIMSGNPKYKDIKITEVKQSFKHCLVLLGRGLYVDTNNKLLEMLSAYNKKHNCDIVFYIKKHPFLTDEEHRQYANISQNILFLGREHSVEEILKSSLVDFSISVNTTAYYESLALGKPCFRWVESENEDFYGMDDKFKNLDNFEDKINHFKSMNQSSIVGEMQRVIRYIFNPD